MDKLLLNAVDYFTETWCFEKSDGTKGLTKSFTFKKEKKIEGLKKMFPSWTIQENGIIMFESFRDTALQDLKRIIKNKNDETEIKFNKRKLNEFLNLVKKINSNELSVKILKENVYKNPNEKDNFYRVLEEYKFYPGYFTNGENLKVALPAAYYGHFTVLEILIKENVNYIDDQNTYGDNSLIYGKFYFIFIY